MASGREKSPITPIRIKQEPIPDLGPSGGLNKNDKMNSFRVPRDLSLGGAGPLRTQRGGVQKKVYTPNLNVVRNKTVGAKIGKDSMTKNRGRERGRPDRGSRGRGSGRGNLVQTSGLFSEGVGQHIVRKSSSGSYRSSGTTDSGDDYTGMRKPTINKREEKIDNAVEFQHLKDILGDSDEDDLDCKKTIFENKPIKLTDAKWNEPIVKIEKTETDTSNDEKKPKIKKEFGDDTIANNLSSLNVNEFNSTNYYPTNMEAFFQRLEPQIFLMQLPDSLPGEDPENSTEEGNTNKDQSKENDDIAKTDNTCTLNHLDEGQIGKIVRYRSGKYKMILGETAFNLDIGMETGFLQELMSIHTNRDERSGNMINLGALKAKITATPDWEYLFRGDS